MVSNVFCSYSLQNRYFRVTCDKPMHLSPVRGRWNGSFKLCVNYYRGFQLYAIALNCWKGSLLMMDDHILGSWSQVYWTQLFVFRFIASSFMIIKITLSYGFVYALYEHCFVLLWFSAVRHNYITLYFTIRYLQQVPFSFPSSQDNTPWCLI